MPVPNRILLEAKTVAMTAVSDTLVAAASESTVALWHVDGTRRKLWRFDETVTALASTSRRLAIGLANGEVRLLEDIDANDNGATRLIARHATPIVSLVFCDDSRRLASAAMDSSDLFIDALLQSSKTHHVLSDTCPVTCLAMHAQTLVSGNERGVVTMWNLDSLASIRTVSIQGAGAIRAMVSWQDCLTIGSDDGVIRALRDDEAIDEIGSHDQAILALAVRQDKLASASADRTIGIWTDNGGCTCLDGHEGSVMSVAFVGSEMIMSGSLDGTLRLWDGL